MKLKVKRNPRTILMVVVAVVIIGCAIALAVVNSSNTTTTTTTDHHTSTTSPKESDTNLQQAVKVSASVAFQALDIPKNPKAHVTPADITKAAHPDGTHLVILKNLGEISSNPQEVVFEWKLGGSPIVVCDTLPTTRAATSADTLTEITQIACTPNLVPRGSQVDNPATNKSSVTLTSTPSKTKHSKK
jgi:hypothetical protein